MPNHEQSNIAADYEKRKGLLKDMPLSQLWNIATDCDIKTAIEIKNYLIETILDENLDLVNPDLPF